MGAMIQRYSRAVRLTAPKIAAETPGTAVEGYWLDDNLFFFLAERIEPSVGRMVAIPSIANTETNSVEEVIPLELLAGLLSDRSGQRADLKALSSVEFDMPDRDTLAVSVGDRDYLVDARRRRVVRARASLEVPALYSPDGRFACFVKGYDLWLKERDTGAERALTTDGAPHHCYGQESETCLSAVTYRQRPYPVGLWSPDSQWFFTHHIDERSVPEVALIQHAPPGGGRPVLHTLKCSMGGDPLPLATYVAIHIASGRVVRFADFPAFVPNLSTFFLRMAWFSGRDNAWFVRCDRYWKQAELIRLDLVQGSGRIVLRETAASGYIDLYPFIFGKPNVRTLAGSDEVIWFSERDGWGHLYLYDAFTGTLKNQITSGEWVVRDIVHVDEEQRTVLFLAGGIDPQADPARRSLCMVNFDGSGFEVRLADDSDIYIPPTEPCGLEQNHPFRPSNARPGISPGGRFGIVRRASVERGNRTEIVDLQTRRAFPIASAVPGSDEMRPRHFTALAADGVTQLHGVMFLPSDFDERRHYPLIDYIYPGPHLTHQPQSFRLMNSVPATTLAELGFVTIMLDSRGTPIGSRAFHQVGYPAVLEPQLSDHAAVVGQLCEQFSFIDTNRIGMIGYSAGGSATMRALCDYGSIFKVGVAVCSFDAAGASAACWADKYLGPEGRNTGAEQRISAAAHKLEGKLLLISADLDENVHLSQTLSLVDALVRANRDFDLLIVPNERHYMLLTNGYVQRRVWDYFVRNLLDEPPPPNFAIRFEAYELAHFEKSLWREYRQ